MLRIETGWLEAVATAERAADLYPSLQGAIELEHATIPVYLSALFSLKPGAMPAVRSILAAIARQEMLHMAIAANVLTALGGAPKMTGPDFVPSYPGHLPMNINGSLVVHLGPLTLARIRDEFLEIEEPEHPLVFPSGLEAAVPFATIGQFYGALIARIRQLDPASFSGDRSRQVADGRWFSTNELFPIVDAASAERAIKVIVEQGEGTSTTPLDEAGDVAHYYRFQEILHGRRLIVDRTIPEGFAYRGDAVPFDQTGVWNMVQDARLANYAPGSRAAILCGAFNSVYTALLNTLHAAFNGRPQALDRAMGIMFELKVVASQLTETIDERTGKAAAPSFEYARE